MHRVLFYIQTVEPILCEILWEDLGGFSRSFIRQHNIWGVAGIRTKTQNLV